MVSNKQPAPVAVGILCGIIRVGIMRINMYFFHGAPCAVALIGSYRNIVEFAFCYIVKRTAVERIGFVLIGIWECCFPPVPIGDAVVACISMMISYIPAVTTATVKHQILVIICQRHIRRIGICRTGIQGQLIKRRY